MSNLTFITQNSQRPFEGGGGGGGGIWAMAVSVEEVGFLFQHLESFINILITNVNVSIYIKN